MTPREKKVARIFQWLMVVWGLWPSQHPRSPEMRASRLHGRMLMVIFPGVFCLEALYIWNHSNANLFEKCHMYITMLIGILAEVRIILPESASYRNLVERFYKEVHLSKYRNHNEFSLEVLRKAEKCSFLLSTIVLPSSFIGNMAFNIFPAYSNWKEGAFADKDKKLIPAFYMSLPFDKEYNVKGWIYCYIFNVYITCAFNFVVLIADLFMFFIIIHTFGHIDILKHNFLTVERLVKNNMFITKEIDDEIFEHLKSLTDHHIFVIRLFNDIRQVYGSVLLLSYFYELVSCSILLLGLSEGTTKAYIRYGPLSAIVFGLLIAVSIVFENLAASINELSNVVYSGPWAVMSIGNQKMVYNILMMSQKEYKFKALGIIDVSIESMITILRCTFSYFAFLKTMKSNVQETAR